jgi:hypothetical protein
MQEEMFLLLSWGGGCFETIFSPVISVISLQPWEEGRICVLCIAFADNWHRYPEIKLRLNFPWWFPHFEKWLYWRQYVEVEGTRSRYAVAFSCASYIGLLTKCLKATFRGMTRLLIPSWSLPLSMSPSENKKHILWPPEVCEPLRLYSNPQHLYVSGTSP